MSPPPASAPALAARILLFIPAYRCARQLPRVIARLTPPLQRHLAAVAVIDNRSDDGSVAAAREALAQLAVPARILLNDANYGLGGSHKVAFDLALAEGFSHVAVLHGDDQADPADLLPQLDAGRHLAYACLLGSRFARGARRQGYSALRTWGNRAFNLLYSAVSARWLSDLGSGLNCFATGWMADRFYHRLGDDLTFNNQLLLALVHRRVPFAFFPITWRDEDQVSNVRLVRQGFATLGIAGAYAVRRGGYFAASRARRPPGTYTASTVYRRDPVP
jgi:glycosyltransferase involved in cell wall biosynthesis